MTDPYAHLPYRAGVGVALFDAKGHVFVGQRLDTPGAWQMPQGGIDAGEDVETAFFRELREETGTDKADILRVHPDILRYDLPPHLLGRLWNGQYRGQDQTWIAARFTGSDADIDIAAHDPPEFGQWQWVPLQDSLKLIVPFKREIYARVITAFGDLALTG